MTNRQKHSLLHFTQIHFLPEKGPLQMTHFSNDDVDEDTTLCWQLYRQKTNKLSII